MIFDDSYFMQQALAEAQKAYEKGEIPIGALIVCNNLIIAKAHNLTETLCDVTAHAEMQVFSAAANYLGAKYLKDCTLYVTIEPCLMCSGAAYWTQISKIVFGAKNIKINLLTDKLQCCHPSTQWVGGVLEKECLALIQDFFSKKR